MTSRDPRRCCEAVWSAILATAWLLVIAISKLLLKITPTQQSSTVQCLGYHNHSDTHRVHALVREFAYAQIGKFQLYFSGNVPFMWPVKSKC